MLIGVRAGQSSVFRAGKAVDTIKMCDRNHIITAVRVTARVETPVTPFTAITAEEIAQAFL
jgi:hypothetical protein